MDEDRPLPSYKEPLLVSASGPSGLLTGLTPFLMKICSKPKAHEGGNELNRERQ